MQTSSRRGIQFPSLDRSDRPDIPQHIKYLVDALEADYSGSMGSLASRPANPGYPRFFWFATDTRIMSFWDGSSWTDIGSADIIGKSSINAKGDLIAGLADNVPGIVSVGPNGQIVIADNTQPAGIKWGLNQVLDLIAAKGDLLVGTGPDALGRMAIGPNGSTVIADSAQTLGVKWGVPVTPPFFSEVTADFPLTLANTDYDPTGLSIVVGPGVYLVTAILTTTRGANAATMTAKIWDGTTTFGGGSVTSTGNNGDTCQLFAQGMAGSIASPLTAGSTTISVRVRATATSQIVKAAATANSVGNHNSSIMAIQVA